MEPAACDLSSGADRGAPRVNPTSGLLLVAGAASALVSAVSVTLLLPVLRRRVVDEPNERSSHSVPTPRGGGLGLMVGVAAGLAIVAWRGFPVGPMWFWGCVGLAALIGLVDDVTGGLSPGVRFVAQIGVAGIVVVVSGPLLRVPLPHPLDVRLGVLGYLAGVVWIVGVINIYNFLDGIDGYAAAQGCAAALGSGLILGGRALPVGVCVAGACAGFLVLNWHPARVFLGDVGSGFLGSVLALLPFAGTSGERSPAVLVMALCLWFFLADGAFTLLRRAARRERLWEAHRSHLYQRLVRAGWSHDRVVLCMMPAALVVVGATFAVSRRTPELLLGAAGWLPFGLALAMSVGIWGLTVVRERGARQVQG